SDAARALLADQLAKPVHFSDTIEHLYSAGVRTFVEVGPKAVLTGLVGRILADRPHVAVALDASQGKRNGAADLARVLAQVATWGHAVTLTAWDDAFVPPPAEPGRKRMTIPVGGANIYEPKRKPATSMPAPAAPQSKPTALPE